MIPSAAALVELIVLSSVGLITSGPGRDPTPFEPPRQLGPVVVVHAGTQC